MKQRHHRKQRQKLQGGAVPHRHWVRRHEWRIAFGSAWGRNEIGRVEEFRFAAEPVGIDATATLMIYTEGGAIDTGITRQL